MVVIEDTANSAYLAVGLSEDPDSWGVDENYGGNDYNYPLYNQFRNQKEGHLSNSDTDNDGRGTTFGLVSQAPALAQNQSHTFSLVAGMGSTKEEAMDIVRTYKNRDIEAEADNFWNSRLNNLFSNLPSFISGDETLNKIYRNSALTYLINRWTTLNLVGELAGYSQSSSFYPWMLGTAGFFPLADAPFWKEQLKKVLILDFANCLAYDAVPGGANRCDHGYTYNNVSVIDGVYRYVTSTSDHKFLDETVGNKTVFQHLQDLAAADDGKEYGSDHLADFGTDHELYEYDIHCDKASNKLLQGKYTGLVVSPNAERIVAHREIAELAEKRGDTAVANTHRAKAGEINTGLQTLWNPVASWFDSISLYDEGLKSRITPLRNTFWGMYPLLLLQYDGLLTDEQKQGLLKQLPQFRGEYGLTSVSTNLRSAWCVRTDWHGPGLYSGATGAVLTGLFKNGQEMEAYDLLSPADGKGYAYLAEMPYLSQAFPSDTQTGGLLPAYLEGVSLAQSLIEGMFGVFPNANQTKIAPHIPARLLSGGPVELRGLKTQGHIWNIKFTSPQNQELDVIVDGAYSPDAKADHFRFEYEMEGTLSVNVSLLQPNTPFTVMAIPVAGGDNVTANGVTDNSGAWQFQLPLHGHYIIRGQTGQSSVTSLTFNNQPLDLAGQPLNTSLTPGPTIDVPVTINYSSGSPRNLIIRFKYETPEPTATTASVSTVSTPAPETTSTGPGNDPKGWLDATFNASCTVSGWTCDGDDFNTPIDVHFYTDGGGTSDKFLGSTKANIQREQAVGDQCGGQRSRGYAFTLPDSIHDGKAHRVYAYGINIGGGTNIQLQGSPKSITCTPR